MINVGTLMNTHVELLRDIPELVSLMADDPTRIFAFHDNMPEATSPGNVWYQVPAPSLMLLWESTDPEEGSRMNQWVHTISAYARVGQWDPATDPPLGFYRLIQLLYLGKPQSIGRCMKDICILSSVGPISEHAPTFVRETDPAGVDFLRVTFKFAEIGDYDNA